MVLFDHYRAMAEVRQSGKRFDPPVVDYLIREKSLNSAPAAPGERSGGQSRVGRNEPCPCGSSKKSKVLWTARREFPVKNAGLRFFVS